MAVRLSSYQIVKLSTAQIPSSSLSTDSTPWLYLNSGWDARQLRSEGNTSWCEARAPRRSGWGETGSSTAALSRVFPDQRGFLGKGSWDAVSYRPGTPCQEGGVDIYAKRPPWGEGRSLAAIEFLFTRNSSLLNYSSRGANLSFTSRMIFIGTHIAQIL